MSSLYTVRLLCGKKQTKSPRTCVVAFSDQCNLQYQYILKVQPCYIQVQISSLNTILENISNFLAVLVNT